MLDWFGFNHSVKNICLNFLLGVIDYAFLLFGALEIVVINGIMRSLKLSSKPMNDLVEEGT